jgi:hypothetical protein
VERAERAVRVRVDALVADGIARAGRAGDTLRQQAAEQIGAPLAELGEVEALIEAEVRRLTGGLPRLRLP